MTNNVKYERIHLIMENASIHRSTLVQEGYFENCSFTVKYLPPWSPMLNPNKQVSSINLVLGAKKRRVECNRLTVGETYLDRLQTACQSFTVANCQGYIRQSNSFWLEALRMMNI